MLRSRSRSVSCLIANVVSSKMRSDKTTPIIKTSEPTADKLAAEYLIDGRVIAVPTDTVYGLACDANSIPAVKTLYEIKGRHESKPIAVCVSDIEQLRRWGHAEHLSDELLNRLLPGPITVVLKRTASLSNSYLNPNTEKIGIRIPDDAFIGRVASLAGTPIALTSANPSSHPSSLRVREFESLHDRLAAVFDGGLLGDGVRDARAGSTVVDLSNAGRFDTIRSGVAHDEIKAILESHCIYSE